MLFTGYINKEWKRESLLIACTPYTERHSSVNIASWIMVRNEPFYLVRINGKLCIYMGQNSEEVQQKWQFFSVFNN